MTRRSYGWFGLFLSCVLAVSTGCALEEGLRDGLIEGSSKALAALIEAPVQAWLDDRYGE